METELFVHFAEIAGVFVGFGALISLRSSQLTDLHDVVYLQGVLLLGLWVVIAGLVPVNVSRYGVQGHPLWLSCAAVALATWAIGVIAFNRTPDSRAFPKRPEPLDRVFPIVGVPLHLVLAGSMILVVVGARPSVDEALYITGLTAGVVFAGWTLLALVLSQRHDPGQERAAADDEAT
ncbi:MAG: hypothetical protein ACOH16_13070 [Propionibacteriaceae bacterium]